MVVIGDYPEVEILIGSDPTLRGRVILDIVVNFVSRFETRAGGCYSGDGIKVYPTLS